MLVASRHGAHAPHIIFFFGCPLAWGQVSDLLDGWFGIDLFHHARVDLLFTRSILIFSLVYFNLFFSFRFYAVTFSEGKKA